MRASTARVCGLCVIVVLWNVPRVTAGQIVGVVADTAGRPLDGAVVDLWTGTQRLASTITDEAGRFHFGEAAAQSARGLIVSRLGFERAVVPAASGDTAMSLVLRMMPIALPALTAEVVRQACPNREQARARTLWEAVRRRYAQDTWARGIGAYELTTRERVDASGVGQSTESRMQLRDWLSVGASRSRQAAGPEGRRKPLQDRIEQNGYAERIADGGAGMGSGDYFSWRYPVLDGSEAFHFVSEQFGSRHSLSVIDSGASGVRIAFCPIERRRPTIEGTLTISEDSALLAARWTFTTPRPQEEAAGEVAFAPYEPLPSGLPHLLAAQGTFWRLVAGRETFQQRSSVYLCWFVSEDQAAPRLPARPTVSASDAGRVCM